MFASDTSSLGETTSTNTLGTTTFPTTTTEPSTVDDTTLEAATVEAGSTADSLTTDDSFVSTAGVESSTPPWPIDWLAPPPGLTPLALPAEYADVEWFDVDRGTVLNSYQDASSCTKVYDRGAGEFGFVECYGGSEHWSCQCFSDVDTYDWIRLPTYFVDTSINTGEACRLATAVCLTELSPTVTNCYDSGEWGGFSAQHCLRDDWCDYHYPTANGDIVESVLMPFVECGVYETAYSSEQSLYRCSGAHITGFDIIGTLDGEAGRTTQNACDVGFQVFFYGIDPGSEGAPNCTPWGLPSVQVIDGQERYCDARYLCDVPATSLGEAISLVYPTQDVGCIRWQDEWTCSCDDGTYTWSNVDGVTACNNALTECMAHESL